MTAEAVLRLVRIMQSDDKLGIVQSLVVGLPSTSAFARLFQFGMRLGMRSYTIGSAWWQADCGPYWGHNALVRLAPFIAHCGLPELPADGVLGGQILSHDQIEAVLMRRAGYEVRVLPLEHQSWEENPATLLEFIRRDLRWCQGNMQYWHLLGLPGLKPVSRYQLAFAILMFVGSPAWIALLVLGTLAAAAAPTPADFIRADFGIAAFAATMVMWLSPKLATFIDVLTRAEGALRVRRHARASSPAPPPRPCSRCCSRRSCGSATRCFSPACRSAARSAGPPRCATTTRCRSASPAGRCGRTRWSASARSSRWR